MKQTGIIFSGPLVPKILDGTKDVTRRMWGLKKFNERYRDVPGKWTFGGVFWEFEPDSPDEYLYLCRCPYGGPGDGLWVRETWRPFDWYRDCDCDDGCRCHERKAVYRACSPDPKLDGPWRPSIHMPRWASRITLEIVDVRPERLQDITEEDAKREGIKMSGGWNADETEYGVNHRIPFSRLWDSINPKHPWASNPWVWRIEFKRMGYDQRHA